MRLLRALLILVLLVVVGFLVVGLWTGNPIRYSRMNPRPSSAVGTTGTVDVHRARERGAELGEKAAVATAKVKETVEEAAITAKIKAKMALDDTVKARAIDVTTNGSTVTVSGTVDSMAEHDRAIALARETAGVTKVVDRLAVRVR